MKVDVQEALASFAIMRRMIQERHPGINEAEAIAYARGFVRGMALAGLQGEAARTAALAASLTDPLLEAGGAFLQVARLEAAVSEKQ